MTGGGGSNTAVTAPVPTLEEAATLLRHYEQEMLELCARGLPGPDSSTLVPFSMKVTATVSLNPPSLSLRAARARTSWHASLQYCLTKTTLTRGALPGIPIATAVHLLSRTSVWYYIHY